MHVAYSKGFYCEGALILELIAFGFILSLEPTILIYLVCVSCFLIRISRSRPIELIVLPLLRVGRPTISVESC